MKIYIGQTRSRSLIAELSALGFGEITQRHEIPPRRKPWALDNGAFGDWRAGRAFDAEQFRKALSGSLDVGVRPDFVVVPDRVAAGQESLSMSMAWVEECRRYGSPYLVVQDGLTVLDISPVDSAFDGIFVGGTLPWKIATGAQWVNYAHQRGKRCHIGRVGTPRRVAWAKRIGVDSIDSCLPLWSRDKLVEFVAAVRGEARQLTLDLGA